MRQKLLALFYAKIGKVQLNYLYNLFILIKMEWVDVLIRYNIGKGV